MKIQAISSANQAYRCQPVRQVEFAKRKNPPETTALLLDVFSTENCCEMEQKYDVACRLAAYYKMQYENLLKTGSVVA